MLKDSALRKLDYIFLILLPITAAAIALTFRTNYLVSTILFFGIASVWFSFRSPKNIIKTMLFTILLAFPLGVVILDYILVADQAWWSPTIFPWRFLEIIPYEDLIWGILQGYLVILMYEHFLDRGKNKLFGKNIRYFLWLLAVLLPLFFVAYIFNPELLVIPYAYFWIGFLFFIIPSVIFLIWYPRNITKFLKLSAYFFYLHIVFEFVALELGNWVFPGTHYLGVFNLLGQRVPIEEMFFWWCFFIIPILTWYEYFNDDQK